MRFLVFTWAGSDERSVDITWSDSDDISLSLGGERLMIIIMSFVF
jgi:hypothetical protein